MARKTIGQRIMASVKVTDDDCWEWQKSRDRYGVMKVRGKACKVHRVAWEWFVGPIPEGLFVLHKCDNPSCCNPNHLFLGTQKDNMQDCAAKGRGFVPRCPPGKVARGDANGMRKHPGLSKGDKNGRSKLTNNQRVAIYQRRKLGETTASLAAEYGVDRSQINRAVKFVEYYQSLPAPTDQ
jgi:hypothetical protein